MRSLKSSLIAVLGALLLAGCQQKIERLEWPAMGTVAAVQARGTGGEKHEAAWVRGLAQPVVGIAELALDAHNPKSDLSKLAACTDAEVLDGSSLEMRPCYAAAFALKTASQGAFDPRWKGRNTLDLGAIAKGFAVDRVDATMKSLHPLRTAALFDLGGNVKSLRGEWRTGVMGATGSGVAATVELHEGESLATSATYFRGAHITDGRTGQPVSNDVASVTVLCPSAMWADGLSTTLFILGPDEGRAFLDNHLSDLTGGLTASVLWIMKDGKQITYGDARFSRD